MTTGGSYDPHAIENETYAFWVQGGYFHGQPNPERRPYVIDIPLPNVTGALHLGHALNNTIQDVLIRHQRMRGCEAMWMPGLDHAGIATQAVVERRLKEEQNLTRHQLGRAGLVRKIWEWKEEYGQRILMQLRKMGFSCDWARTRFTLDEVCARAVYEVFFQWFKAGLIYRGTRLVNWDAYLQTAVADDEIVHETVKGSLWHYRYPIRAESSAATSPPGNGGGGAAGPQEDIEAAIKRAASPDAQMGRDYLTIATTRPETMLGDTAVAVHPDDPRYRHLIGRQAVLPLLNRPIPIIADPILVKMEFGTGCVKVTPGHDPNDYECAKRHKLPMINILTPDGKINASGGPYAGQDRYAARKKVVEDLERLGLLEKVEPYETDIGHSDRSKTPIEPMLSEQWFVKMGDLAEMAMEAVRDGRVRFFPQRYEQMYLDWLGEKRDWCISRQLWWGHRIPVWTLSFRDWREAGYVSEEAFRREAPAKVADVFQSVGWALGRDLSGDWCASAPEGTVLQVCCRGEDAHRVMQVVAQALSGRDPREALRGLDAGSMDAALRESLEGDLSDLVAGLRSIEQDPDVLDTWFSSALWPFSTLGWPHDPRRNDDPSRDRKGTIEGGRRSDRTQPLAHARGSDQVLPTLADFEYFYPTSTLVTGRGIITLWVARMVMTSLYFTGRVPFQHVHIHPIILDGQGRIMSKSLGNGVDPLDIIELYGTDALRFVMAQMDTETQDVRMPVKPVKLPARPGSPGVPPAPERVVNSSEKFEIGRNFCNKIWQAATGFVLPHLDDSSPRPLHSRDLALEDLWILSRLTASIAECDRRLERYQISELANTLYGFFWNDFCDWYLELVKPRLFGREGEGGLSADAEVEADSPAGRRIVRRADASAQAARQVLAWVLDQSLRLLHPIMPYITEALWQKLNAVAPVRGIREPARGEPALIRAAWPSAAAWARDPNVETELAALQDVIRALRDVLTWINTTRAAGRQPAIGKLPQAVIRAAPALVPGLRQQSAVICRLGRCATVAVGADLAKPPESATKVVGGVEIFVPIGGLADLRAERRRLGQERERLTQNIRRLEEKLDNAGFVAKAPPAVVEKERARLSELCAQLAVVDGHLAELGE